MKKTHLGDGVYVDFNGYSILLTTENGIRATNTIYLEGDVWTRLKTWVDDLLKPAPTEPK